MKSIMRAIALTCSVLTAAMVTDGILHSTWVTPPAAAVFGRPLTPVSAAGVARRTTRRTIYATSAYVAALPVGYSTVVVEGTSLYYYNGVYYQSSGNQYVIVTVN
ncbi:MAG: DUF6515 family protein [Leptolyngbyaceae cyanobacterium bins.349]|nr:DUF6515 family protein [Leptolyngbyaceae cyanobacterium bins.349]